MAKFKVIKPFRGELEGKNFEEVGEVVELTVKRAEEIQFNIDNTHPNYGGVLERVEETPKARKTTDEDKSESVKK